VRSEGEGILMDSSELARLIAAAEQLSPERYPDQAITLNQRIVQLDPDNAASHLRLARGYQAERNFAAATMACQDALRLQPLSVVAQRRLQRITEEWDFYRQAQAIESYEEAIRRGVTNKDQDRVGLAIAYLWRAVDLSATKGQAIRAHNALAAAYRSRKDLASLDRAAEQYEWVLRRSPMNVRAKAGLTAVLQERREASHDQQASRDRQRQKQWEQRKQRQQRKRAGQQQKPAHRLVKKPTTPAEALRVLNLTPPVTQAEIKRAYREQAQLAHPDHGGSHAAMVVLNAAYELALASASEPLFGKH
jgi:hypothetical protein